MHRNKNPLLRRIIFTFLCVFLNPLSAVPQSRNSPWSLVIGTPEGLAGINREGGRETLWEGGAVRKILSAQPAAGAPWVILTSEGILESDDLRNWRHRDNGLPKRAIKVYADGKTGFVSTFQEIKDLERDPQNPDIMAAAVKNAVYLTTDGGETWKNLSMPNYRSNGIKAVAVTTLDNSLTVFCSHSIYGLYWLTPDNADAEWQELNTGLEKLETTENPDEISDIAIRLTSEGEPELIVSQTFRPRVYRLDWERREFSLFWPGREGFGTIDSLVVSGNTLRFIQDNEVLECTIPVRGQVSASRIKKRNDLKTLINTIPENLDIRPNCAVFPEQSNRNYTGLCELWLLLDESAEQKAGADREGIYLPVNHAMDPYSLAPYMETLETRNLDMVVIDMKDDYGRLRFSPRNPEITKWGRVFRPVDIEAFVGRMKEAGVYTVARVVVFKDPEAAARSGGKYAVWDSRNNIPWEGYYDVEQKKNSPVDESSPVKIEVFPGPDADTEILRTYYDEKWVDPYAEEYWEYIAALSEELGERGFDEIQYDYIRFPTDGINLGSAVYRWQGPGMDMDSAIISFLRHVRGRVNIPISVDVYGANGWYRTGARTGQETELLAPWVDIICPMYYPSHFEQDFLAQNPPEERPYRIYYEGTMRTGRIARNSVIVRPWVQAFYLNVAYDRRYYDTDYVRREIDGTRAAGPGGFTYWNNSGRYEDIPLPE